MREFNLAQRNGMLLVDDLDRLAIVEVKGGAQSFMAAHHFSKGVLQRRDIQLATKGNRGQQVVGEAGRLKLIEEPKPPLGKGQRRGAILLAAWNSILGRRDAFLAQKRVEDCFLPGRTLKF